MRCAKCKQYFDIICANFSEDVFITMSSDFKKTWICFECRSLLPKHDNSNTPVRQPIGHNTGAAASGCLDISMHTPDNVTLRNNRQRPSQITPKGDNDQLINMVPVVHEIKQMQDDFEMRLTAKICTLLTEQFNEFKSMVFEKISHLSTQVDKLEERIQTMDTKRNGVHQGNPVVIRDPSNMNNVGKNKPKLNSKIQPEPPLQEKVTHSTPKLKATTKTNPTSGPHVASTSTSGVKSDAVITHGIADATPDSKDNGDQEKHAEWTVAGRTKRGRTSAPGVLRGTAAPGTTALRASERWRYLHLYYVQEGTTIEQVRAHLHSICGNNDCTVDELKSRGRYSSFKLGVPSKVAESVMSPNNWAEDICVKPWRQNFRAKEKRA